MLSKRGRRVLAGKERALKGVLARRGVLLASGLLDARVSREVPALLQRAFADVLEPFAIAAPPAETASVLTALERLPIVGRGASLAFGPLVESRGSVRAAEIGLTQLCASESARRFAEVLAGAKLSGPTSMKVLAQRAGDYSGPSTGHLPEDASARLGYVELELSFGTPGISRQLLVHERDGHLQTPHAIDWRGGVMAWRLPRWRYTTPLETRRKSACRWQVSHTYYYVPAEQVAPPVEPPPSMRN